MLKATAKKTRGKRFPCYNSCIGTSIWTIASCSSPSIRPSSSAAQPDSAEEVTGEEENLRNRKAEICITFWAADGKETKLKARCTVSEKLNDDGRLFWREILPIPHTFKPDWVKAQMKDLAILKEAAVQRYYKL